MNHKIKTIFFITTIIFLAGCDIVKTKSRKKKTDNHRIIIAGSSTIRPVIEKISSAFRKKYPEYTIIIAGGGSTRGIESTASGKIMIGMASRDINNYEIEEFPLLIQTTIGYDGIVFIVNNKNPINEIDSATIKNIYTGKLEYWKHNHEKIIPLAKEKISTTSYLFLKHFNLYSKIVTTNEELRMLHKLRTDKQYSNLPVKIIPDSQDAVELTIKKTNVISYASIGKIKNLKNQTNSFKTLSLNNINPTIANIINKKYPICRNLNLITLGQPSGTIKKFIDFVLSKEGQNIIVSSDFIITGN